MGRSAGGGPEISRTEDVRHRAQTAYNKRKRRSRVSTLITKQGKKGLVERDEGFHPFQSVEEDDFNGKGKTKTRRERGVESASSVVHASKKSSGLAR